MWKVLTAMWLLGYFMATNAFGMDQWLCTEDSSQIQGSRILACGVGEAMTEAGARKVALLNAEEEFQTICAPETICGQHKYSASPSRATCERSEDGWKCYRLVVYEIKKDYRKKFAMEQPKQFQDYSLNVRDHQMDMIDAMIDKQLRSMQ